ncbi:MAG: SCO family protein [Colwellia sp.]|nr:SCO family protein [Colwellia sp.]
MKTLPTSQQVLILLPILVVITLTVFFYRFTANAYHRTNLELPIIQGLVLKDAQQLAGIQLTDHQGQAVNRDYFLGSWHFITYGYTHCPDICPTTLFTLTQLANLLSANHDSLDTQFIFYTVDPDRDSQAILTQYIHYFSDKFVAMRADDLINAEKFQQSLGIKVEIIRGYINDDDKHINNREKVILVKRNADFYQVNHGLAIFLLNPEAELQAIFLPEITKLGIKNFTSDMLYRDYLKIVKYYQQRRLL